MGSSPRGRRGGPLHGLALRGLVLSGLLLGLLLRLVFGGAARAEEGEAPQVLGVQVAVSHGVAFSSVWAETSRLGETRVLPLADDGTVPEDLPWDGIYVGSEPGPYSRYVTLRLYGRLDDATEALLWEGTVRTEDAFRPTLGFRVAWQGDHLRAERVALALPTGPGAIAEGLPLLVAFGWGLFVLTFVGILVRRPPVDPLVDEPLADALLADDQAPR